MRDFEFLRLALKADALEVAAINELPVRDGLFCTIAPAAQAHFLAMI